MLNYLVIIVVLFIAEFAYFKLADHFNIIDKPNHRSSHTSVTIRGGGVTFCLAALIFFFSFGFQFPYFMLGLFLISAISFVDDIITLNNKIRLGIHLIAVILMFFQWHLFQFNWYWIPIAAVFVIGTINAYNFMDGINGITGLYSLLAIVTFYYINEKIIAFTNPDLLITVGLSSLVFNFFNFRKNAKCFAGDVGSVSIAFIIIFVLGQLILKTNNFAYILLLLVYGLDTATTVFFRKIRKENIFEAHRSHFYQYLANHRKYSHRIVAGLYMLGQLIVNIIVLTVIQDDLFVTIIFTAIVAGLFLLLRFALEGKQVLLKTTPTC